MELQKIIESTNYVEAVNKVDNLINELLYSQDRGYINLQSKDAINQAKNVIEKFNYEADKISRTYGVSLLDDIVKDKKQYLLEAIQKHYSRQAYFWAYDVFSNTLDNCILKASLNNSDKDVLDEVYNTALCAVSWISSIASLSEDAKNSIISDLNMKFQNALNSKDSDYINPMSAQKSDSETFLQIWYLIKDSYGDFISLDLQNLKTKLIQEDLNYFQKIKNTLLTNKTAVIDEINLIDYAIQYLKIESSDLKYSFIKAVYDDFSKCEHNSDNDKSEIIKRRMKLFTNKNGYYKELLGF